MLANFALASLAMSNATVGDYAWSKIQYTPNSTLYPTSPNLPAFTIPSPDLSCIISSIAEDRVSVTVPGGFNAVSLMHRGGSGGARYRFNAGSWTTLALSGSNALEVKALTGLPTTCSFLGKIVGTTLTVLSVTSGAISTGMEVKGPGIEPGTTISSGSGTTWTVSIAQNVRTNFLFAGANMTMDIEVVSGTCELYGADIRNGASGIRWNKCAMAGTRADHHLAALAADRRRAYTQLASDLVLLMLGTNDRYVFNAATFAGYMSSLADDHRAATPNADLVLISPPENLATGTSNSMVDLAYALRTVADTKHCGHRDLQPDFGLTVADYGDSGTRYFTTTDANTRIHPSTPEGDAVVGSAMDDIVFGGTA